MGGFRGEGGSGLASKKRIETSAFGGPCSSRSLGCFSEVRSQLRNFDELGTCFQGVSRFRFIVCAHKAGSGVFFMIAWPGHQRCLAFRAWSEMGFHKLRHHAAGPVSDADCKA